MHGRADFNLFFSLRGCDALLIGHRSGRLLPNQDQGKLMSLCREKAEFVLLSLAVCCIDIRGADIRPRLTLTAHQRALGEEMRKCDGGKSLERRLRPRYADRKICE